MLLTSELDSNTEEETGKSRTQDSFSPQHTSPNTRAATATPPLLPPPSGLLPPLHFTRHEGDTPEHVPGGTYSAASSHTEAI